MTSCIVYRCPLPATGTFTSPGGSRRSAGVCGEHQELLEAGAEWRWDERGILVGEDLRALGEYVVESMHVWHGVGEDSVSPDGYLTMQLKLRRRGTVDLDERTVLLSVEDAARWAMGFKFSTNGT